MSPDQEIEKLDRMLAERGEDVTLTRTVGTANQGKTSVKCRAFVRGYKPDELVGPITQGDSKVSISPTEINAAQWPGGQALGAQAPGTDPRVPRKGDQMIIQGRTRAVEAAEPIYKQGVLVRINIHVKG